MFFRLADDTSANAIKYKFAVKIDYIPKIFLAAKFIDILLLPLKVKGAGHIHPNTLPPAITLFGVHRNSLTLGDITLPPNIIFTPFLKRNTLLGYVRQEHRRNIERGAKI